MNKKFLFVPNILQIFVRQPHPKLKNLRVIPNGFLSELLREKSRGV